MSIRRFGVAFLALIVMTIGSCTAWRSSVQPSVLLILVEGLGFSSFSCNETPEDGRRVNGLYTFCQEAVRFTHAYAPSTLSQATVASILTGKYPHQHSVRHNGPQFLSAKEVTLAEVAFTQGYRTSLFSGGPPIFRRGGLNQGFDLFEDNVQVMLNRLYQPISEITAGFLNWQENEAPRGRFFSVLYASDLQFIDAPTTDELGELRESSYQSQIEELDEALAALIKEMKRRRIWDSTDVFLIGLNGHAPDVRFDEMPPTNLYSEMTRATLMIKPSRKTRDGPFNWKIDSNVSLVDVGATVFDILGKPQKQPTENSLTSTSLRTALTGPQPDWSEDRVILSESAWPVWRSLGDVRAAIRKGPYLYLFDEPDKIYNTLTDGLEILPLPLKDTRSVEMRAILDEFLATRGFSAWTPHDRQTLAKFALGRDLWREIKLGRSLNPDLLRRLKDLANRYPEDTELAGWRAIWAVRHSDWRELKAVAEKPVKRPLWAFVAAKNLNEKVAWPADACMKSFEGAIRNLDKKCGIDALVHLMDWLDEGASEVSRTRGMEAFLRSYTSRQLETRVAEHNQVVGLTWDASSSIQGPDVVDLILALPEMKKYRAQVQARMGAR